MQSIVDPIILLIIGGAVFAEARRGLYLTLADAVRIALALGIGLLGWRITTSGGGGSVGGIIMFFVPAVVSVLAATALLRKMGLDPEWGRTVVARIAAGTGGFFLGLAICVVVVPLIGWQPALRGQVLRSNLARPFLDCIPRTYETADRLGITVPRLRGRRITIEQESGANIGIFADRVNFTRLDGSVCIECGEPVRFQGYVRRGFTVSPRFLCTGCTRTSDGCQTFEGFHQMYGLCAIEYTRSGRQLDCGIRPNNRPVVPVGECPACGLARR
ncbi:MAG: hypothetical protein JSU73_01515 [candidate division WOR-3 bacterium]|nr:MAG: hypothetical protein JSU73_01515 [candidate division WOR-3 bacterium]